MGVPAVGTSTDLPLRFLPFRATGLSIRDGMGCGLMVKDLREYVVYGLLQVVTVNYVMLQFDTCTNINKISR